MCHKRVSGILAEIRSINWTPSMLKFGTTIILKFVNTNFEPITLTGTDEGPAQAIAEFIEVLGG